MATHSSILAWEIPGQKSLLGVIKTQTRLSDWAQHSVAQLTALVRSTSLTLCYAQIQSCPTFTWLYLKTNTVIYLQVNNKKCLIYSLYFWISSENNRFIKAALFFGNNFLNCSIVDLMLCQSLLYSKVTVLYTYIHFKSSFRVTELNRKWFPHTFIRPLPTFLYFWYPALLYFL